MVLAEMKCESVAKGSQPMSEEEITSHLLGIPLWNLRGKALEREFVFPDFRRAIEFVNKVVRIAEAEDHHPDIHIYYNRVRLELFTHKISGLSRNDFILASKINRFIDHV